MPGRVDFLSLNINSLQKVWKRTCLIQYLRKYKLKLVFLQETHSMKSRVNSWNVFKNEFVIIEGAGNRPSQGVVILISYDLGPTATQVLYQDNRLICVKIMLCGEWFVLINFYASFNTRVNGVYYDKIYKVIKSNPLVRTIFSGDLNQNGFVRSAWGVIFTKELRLVNMAGLVGLQNCHTHVAAKGNSTIDFVFISLQLTNGCSFKLYLNTLSDHLSLVGSIELHGMFNVSHLKKVVNVHPALPFTIELINEIYIVAALFCTSNVYILLVWEKIKMGLKALLVKFNRDFNLQNTREARFLESMLEIPANVNTLSASTLSKARDRYRSIQEANLKLKKYQLLKKLKLAKNDFSLLLSSRLFYLLDKKKPLQAIKHEGEIYVHRKLGELLSDTLKNNFDRNTVAIRNSIHEEDAVSYTHLSKQSVSWLSFTKIYAQLMLINKRVAAGPDGISVKFYRKFAYLLIPILMIVFTEWTRPVTKSLCHIGSYFTCFDKMWNVGREDLAGSPGFSLLKDIRPINNENCDAKLFARLMNQELFDKVAGNIHYNQFALKGRTIHNALFLLKEVHFAAKTYRGKGPIAVFFDMEKAFDNVSHDYLLQQLREMIGVSPLYYGIENYIRNKRGTVKYGNEFFEEFIIRNGISQGSPISSLLYAVYINQCLCRLEQNIVGIFVPSLMKNVKLIAYADDLVLFCDDMEEINIAIDIIREFTEPAGLKINMEKTTACYVKNWAKIDFRGWRTVKKFLGLPYPFFDAQARIAVQTRLIDQISTTIRSLSNIYISIKLRVRLLNMLCIPKLNYFAPHFKFPCSFIKRLDVLFNKFIWRKKLPLIARKYLQLSPRKGGLGLIRVDMFLSMLKVNAFTNWMTYLKVNEVEISIDPTDTPPPVLINSITLELWKDRLNFIDDLADVEEGHKFRYSAIRDEVFTHVFTSDFCSGGVKILKSIESVYINPNVFDFAYKIVYQRLQTNNLLKYKYNMDIDVICVMCERQEESQHHLLCSCEKTLIIRTWMQDMVKRDIVPFTSTDNLLMSILDHSFILKFVFLCWFLIWKIRCAKLFTGTVLRPLVYIKQELRRVYQGELLTLGSETVGQLWPNVNLDSVQWAFLNPIEIKV